MSMYYEGYNKARDAVAAMDESELLDYLDDLYGRDNLSENFTLDDLRLEAYSQCRKDFTDVSSKEYEIVSFYKKLHAARKQSA